MSPNTENNSDIENGLCIIAVIILIILAFPIGLFIAAYLDFLKRMFFGQTQKDTAWFQKANLRRTSNINEKNAFDRNFTD